MRAVVLVGAALWLGACDGAPAGRVGASGGAAHAAALDPTVHAAPPARAERVFGKRPGADGETLEVAEVLKDPASYLHRDIRCRGTVARVCQAAGCWLELQGSAGVEGLRVPMAGHSFFVPQDIVGSVAVVEGRLAARELHEAERAHLTGEGLKATGPLFLEATGVVVR
jgi:hypothetical protein